MTIKLRSFSALTLATVAATSTVSAIDAGGIAIHGSLSATGAYSDKYHYYGETAEHFDLIARELTLNGAYRFENGLRAAAQIYAYDVAGYRDLTLDFATLDYSFSQNIGVRVGRNKLPQGLYGDVQDLDQVRTFASLPLNFYPRATRSLSSGYNGAALYGTIGLSQAGSLEYQLIAGWMSNIDKDSPFAQGLVDLTTVDTVDLDKVFGGALTWNAPVEGLKFNYTHTFVPDIEFIGRVQTRAGFAASDSAFGAIASMVDAGYGAGTWDYSGLFAGSRSVSTADSTIQVWSAEYAREKWLISAEYKKSKNESLTTLAAAAPLGVTNSPSVTLEEHWYVQATYQATDKAGFGVYYAQSDFDPKDKNTADKKLTSVNDLAAAASYAVTANWLVKVEAHALDGLGKLNIAGDRNFGATDASWNYFVVKTTFTF